MAPFEAKLYDTDLVNDALDKLKLIQERLRTTQSGQKSYTDQKARDLSFMVGEKVLLNISLMKGIMRFGKKVKLSPRFISPFKVLSLTQSLVELEILSSSLIVVIMERKGFQNKRKIKIKFIKNKRSEKVMFYNMQKALCKKAKDISSLCGIEIAIIIFLLVMNRFYLAIQVLNRFLIDCLIQNNH
ncbi:uncharacterized protein [Nicotiana tomentosiformis]|uniref:uncharacterized protein n=1 Tax=Nicotiana tomentosiformis TaxID=4098 RepID=UPI00388C777D